MLSVAQRRWPAVRFEVRNTAVQGPTAVPQIIGRSRSSTAIPVSTSSSSLAAAAASRTCCRSPTRRLCRAIVACTRRRWVSAIGHEPDSPLRTQSRDLRAATPTDAAKRVVPDAVAEQSLVSELRGRAGAALRNWVARNRISSRSCGSRPVLADPCRRIDRRAEEVERLRDTARRERHPHDRRGGHRRRAPAGAAGHARSRRDPRPRLRGGAARVRRHRTRGAAFRSTTRHPAHRFESDWPTARCAPP